MEITFRTFIVRIVICLLQKGLLSSGYSVTWNVVYENKECHLDDAQSFYKEDGLHFVTDCARLCTNSENCVLFQYDWPLEKCMLYAMSVPYQISCTPGYQVFSYRKLKVGCSGPGYVYDVLTGYCVSFVYGIPHLSSWDGQKSKCEAKGEQLAIVDTMEKFVLLQDIIKSNYDIGLYHYWIGGKKVNGTFKWINGEDMPLSLDYWESDPNTYSSNLECIWYGNSYLYNFKWKATLCNTNAQYFCEKAV